MTSKVIKDDTIPIYVLIFSRKQNSERARSSQIWNERDAFVCFGELRLVISHRGIPITQALR